MAVRAFSGCSSLKEFEIVGNVSVVDYYAFENCTSLVEIEFPEGLTQLTGDGHFCGCTALQRVIFPSSLELIDDPFWGGGYIIFPQIIYNADPKHWAGITNVQQMSQYDVDFAIDGTDSGECGTNVSWTFDSAAKKLTVEPVDPSQSASVNGYTLDNSAAPWSLYRGSIQTLEIKEGVTAIREQAFTGMDISTVFFFLKVLQSLRGMLFQMSRQFTMQEHMRTEAEQEFFVQLFRI